MGRFRETGGGTREHTQGGAWCSGALPSLGRLEAAGVRPPAPCASGGTCAGGVGGLALHTGLLLFQAATAMKEEPG